MQPALILAVLCSITYGAADFLGGIAPRRSHILRTVVIAAPASLLIEVVLWPFLGAVWSPAAVWWGCASGLGSAAALVLLYRTLAIGPMSVLSPITALASAVLPVAVGLLGGEGLTGVALVGLVLALVAVVMVSTGPPGAAGTRASTRPSTYALLLALGAGTAIAVQLVCLDRAPDGSGLAPLLAGRAASSVLVLAIAAGWYGRLGDERPSAPAAVAAGVLDSLANLLFLLAARRGDLAVVAVITALYPAGTVLLARVLLAEHLHRVQLAGLGLAAVAVSLLAVS